MTSIKVVTSFIEFANQGDMENCLNLLSDDLVWTDIGTTRFSGRYEGKARVLEELIGPLFSRLKGGILTEVGDIIAEGNRVVVLSTGRAETNEGIRYDNAYCQIFTVEDGRIVEVVEYCDTALVDRVFGKRA